MEESVPSRSWRRKSREGETCSLSPLDYTFWVIKFETSYDKLLAHEVQEEQEARSRGTRSRDPKWQGFFRLAGRRSGAKPHA